MADSAFDTIRQSPPGGLIISSPQPRQLVTNWPSSQRQLSRSALCLSKSRCRIIAGVLCCASTSRNQVTGRHEGEVACQRRDPRLVACFDGIRDRAPDRCAERATLFGDRLACFEGFARRAGRPLAIEALPGIALDQRDRSICMTRVRGCPSTRPRFSSMVMLRLVSLSRAHSPAVTRMLEMTPVMTLHSMVLANCRPLPSGRNGRTIFVPSPRILWLGAAADLPLR